MLCMAILAAPAGGDPGLAEDTFSNQSLKQVDAPAAQITKGAFSKSDDRESIHQIQKRLMALGYAPGKLDGIRYFD